MYLLYILDQDILYLQFSSHIPIYTNFLTKKSKFDGPI